jgi:hypothetical protein
MIEPEQRMSEDHEAPPIVEDERRPQMSDRPRPPRRISGKVVLMPEEPQAPKSGAKRMEPVPKKGARAGGSRRRKGSLPDQVEPKPSRAERAEDEGYLRIRVRAEDGELQVKDIRGVEGPLVADEELHGDLAYEVTIGGRRVSSGAIPDVGAMRSFPPPDPAPGQEGHHFTPTPSYEFLVRIPKQGLSPKSLSRLGIRVYRVKSPVARTEGPEPLGERFEGDLREVGRIQGIRLEELPKSVQAEARRALR